MHCRLASIKALHAPAFVVGLAWHAQMAGIMLVPPFSYTAFWIVVVKLLVGATAWPRVMGPAIGRTVLLKVMTTRLLSSPPIDVTELVTRAVSRSQAPETSSMEPLPSIA